MYTAVHQSAISRYLDRALQARVLPDTQSASQPECPGSPSSFPAQSCPSPCSRSHRSQLLIACARSFRSRGDFVPLRTPTRVGAGSPSHGCAAHQLSMTVLGSCQQLTGLVANSCLIPWRCSSTGVCKSFWSLKKSQSPWSGAPVTFSSILTGFGNCWFAKSFCLTDSVCLGRRPVLLTADSPRLLLLSFLQRGCEVEKRAADALRVHWTEGTRKESTASDLADVRLGRSMRDDGIAIMSLGLCCRRKGAVAENAARTVTTGLSGFSAACRQPAALRIKRPPPAIQPSDLIQTSRSSPCVGRLLIISIFPEEFLDFTSGYQDPRFTIPTWSTLAPTCSSFPANGEQQEEDCGQPPINWDYALTFSIADTSASLVDSTTLPLSASSSTTSLDSLMGGLIAPSASPNNDPDWNTFSLPSSDSQQFLGDGTQLASDPSFFTTTEANMNMLTMSSGMGELHHTGFSTPMMKGKAATSNFTSVD